MQFLASASLEVPSRLARAFEKVRSAIERDDLRSADVKKLRGHDFLRAKLDYGARLLVQFVEHAGRRACLALEVIESHAYDRSRFLRGARVDEATALDGDVVTEQAIAASLRPVRYLHPERVTFEFLDKPICFDDRQEEVRRLPLPLIVVGCAGSGKTALTLTKLREIPGDVLYVTQSAFLAENAATLYFAHGYENESQSVDFLSYRKLLESIEVPAGRAVTLKDFRLFFERHRASFRFTTAHALFEELRGVVTASPEGPLSFDGYLALGIRQSIFAPEERRSVMSLLPRYVAWLAEARLYDPNLLAHAYRAKATPRYDAVVVDEIQDLTNAELSLVLALLKEPMRFLLCGDSNQIVHPNFFSWSKVKSLFYVEEERAVAAPIHVLEANYRSSRTVCELANRMLRIKNARFGSIDRESTALVRPASIAEGRVAGLVKKDAVLHELDKRTRGSARVCVIVLSEDQKAEARRKFSTPLVFSVSEAKGLEYEAIVLYDIVSSERARFGEIAQGVSTDDAAAGSLVFARAKDKGDKSLEVYKFFVNALYVAITRAIETVYVVESDPGHALFGLLGVPFSEDVTAFAPKASTTEEWQKEARRLELQGKQEQADAIRQNILRHTPVPWTVIDHAGFDEVHRKVFAPGSVFTKAKQQLHEFAAFHEISPLAVAVETRSGYRPQKSYREAIASVRARFVPMYAAADPSRVTADVARYGLEHRNMMGLTPLMMAASAGNVALAETLLERGARPDAVDSFGRMPVHFALRSAFRDATFAREKLGPLYDRLCPSALDFEVDGRLVRIAKNMGEFFVVGAMLARFHDFYGPGGFRRGGFTAAMLDEKAVEAFPRSVLPEERRRRVYWNGVLARAEVVSTYRPARRLWERERLGQYVPSEGARLRVVDDRGGERLVSLRDALRVGLFDGQSGGER